MAWRAMTAEEMATRPEARLEGSLMLITVCAATLAVAAILFLLFMLVAIPMALGGGGIFASAFRGPAALSAIYMIPVLYVMVWGLAFLIMTIMRSASAPGFASIGLVGWIGVRLLTGIAGQVWMAAQYNWNAGVILQSGLPILLTILGDVILAAGFWIYMRDGARPNGYYRRLIQA